MNNNKTWILGADASIARLYAMHKARFLKQSDTKELALINQFAHEASRKKVSELITDKMGEFGSGTFVENTNPKLHEAEQFAHEIIHYLDMSRKDKDFRDLIIIAPPTFMGLLHKHMPGEINKLISQTIEKDYTKNNAQELIKNLLQHL